MPRHPHLAEPLRLIGFHREGVGESAIRCEVVGEARRPIGQRQTDIRCRHHQQGKGARVGPPTPDTVISLWLASKVDARGLRRDGR